jgi:hypothetical protein
MTYRLTESEKVRQIAIYVFSFVTVIYLLSVSLPNIYSVDQYYQRYEVTRSIVENFDVSIPDSNGGVIKGIDGRTYSLYGLGWSVLSIPFYIAGKFIGRSPQNLVSIMNLVAGSAIVSLVFLFTIALGYSKRGSLGVAIFYGFGTLAWPLAKQPFDHVVETLFVLLSLYFMYIHVSNNKTKSLILAAICLGIAINTRLVSILVLPPLLVMMGAGCGESRRFVESIKVFSRKTLIFMLVFLPFAGSTLWYNYYRFGSAFETGFQLFAAKTGIDFFSGTTILTGLMGFLASPGKGFFYYSPIAIFFFFCIVPFYQRHRWQAIVFILLILSYLLFLSRNIYWHGDWAWGPRYLLAITPFLIIPIAELLDSVRWRKNNPFTVLPVYIVFTLSLLVQISAVSVHFYNYFIHLKFDQNVQFTVVQAEGVPTVIEPHPEIYFSWAKSPILMRLKEIKRIGTEITNYRYEELPQTATEREKMKADPSMHIFDFWWVYMYFVNRRYVGFLALAMFLIMAAAFAIQMTRLSQRGAFHPEGSQDPSRS